MNIGYMGNQARLQRVFENSHFLFVVLGACVWLSIFCQPSLTYALGREMRVADLPTIKTASEQLRVSVRFVPYSSGSCNPKLFIPSNMESRD